MLRRPPRSTPLYSSAASDVYKRQLFFYLPERGVLVPFVSVGLALREDPVVVAGPVHERDLVTGAEPSSDPGPSRERSKDDAARGAHRGWAGRAAGLGPAHSHWWCFLRRARCHAAGHARLAASQTGPV